MLRFRVDGMSCGHCVQSVTNAVRAADPKAEVQVDLSAKSVTVQSGIQAEAVADAIRGAGYEVILAP